MTENNVSGRLRNCTLPIFDLHFYRYHLIYHFSNITGKPEGILGELDYSVVS